MQSQKEIDYLKAFAIFLVVFYHAIYAAKLFMGNMFYIRLDIALEHIHVPLFILIAGYLCHKQDIGQFYRKKVSRIFIPFLFMSCLKLLYNNLISAEHIHEGNIFQQLYDAFICGGTYWFCYCLLVIFAFAPLFWDNRRRTWTVLLILVVVNLLMQWQGLQLTSVLQFHKVVDQMPFFLVGMLLQSYGGLPKLKKRRSRAILIPSFAILAIICGYLRLSLDIYSIWLVDALFGISIMYFLYLLAGTIRGKIPDRILTAMGKYSLQIMFFDSFFRIILYRMVYLVLDPGMAAVLTVTVLDIALSCAVCPLARKIPVLSKLVGV